MMHSALLAAEAYYTIKDNNNNKEKSFYQDKLVTILPM